jgi:hypothetical protein
MKIMLPPDVYLRLSMVESVCQGREFSGYGFVEVDNTADETLFRIYDIEILDVGSVGYTEFDSQAILEVMQRPDAQAMKCWIHRHPLGNGKPGPHNWSGTDNATCRDEPLGCPDPDKVKWALAMVLTPGGWVGRVDQYKNGQQKTTHLEVEIDIDWSTLNKAKKLLAKQKETEKEEEVKVERQLPKYFSERGEYDTDFDSAHAAIDEAFNIIDVAEYQLKDGWVKEAIDSTAWCYDLARYYEDNMYVRDKVKRLLKKTTKMMNKLKRETKHG